MVPLTGLKRGPKPRMPDTNLLEAIRPDLTASPFTGEGHRKVWARLRILRDIRASRNRVLRLMREHGLLSPHRRPQGKPDLHDGRITTDHPNEMWGTDGTRIETAKDGMVWIFAAIDHCDALCTGSMWSRPATASRRRSRLARGCTTSSEEPVPTRVGA
jgi:putative transposase